ncbi:MAG: TraR/DksA C4-type zinc finger protein [Chloroflexi bacterium]|nr:TraR/DksA C4-type zinc finger protein [Chloroflexota bacterium]
MMQLSTSSLDKILQTSAALHHHLCPRQVIGARMGLYAGHLLRLDLPQTDKRLLTFIETDGCASDGVAVATNCWVGQRTMRVEDYGKVAATFVDTQTGEAIRLVPRADLRQRAHDLFAAARHNWEAELLGYQRLPAEEMFTVQPVTLNMPLEKIISRAGRKALCNVCGEEIMNERQILRAGLMLCRACAGESYYRVASPDVMLYQPLVEATLLN